MDLQKAFDTVNHDILLYKLHCYGVRGINHEWFRSYLYNRKQYTYQAGCSSTLSNIDCGVPQGSVLGPLLFLIYINDICNAVPDDDIFLFADDSNLFIRGKSKIEVMERANLGLSNLNEWFLANKLSLSLDKICYTVFPANKRDGIYISLGQTDLKHVHSCKYLGITIDADLKWIDHVNSVYKKLIKYVGIFYKLRKILPIYCLKSLYFAFVHSHLLYGVEIYGNACSKHLDKLVKLNNKILRILQNVNIRTHVTDLYTHYCTLPIPILHELQLASIVHKFYRHLDILPDIFRNYFTRNTMIHHHNTRQHTDLHINRVHSSKGQKSFKYKGCSIWNGLPDSLKESRSVKGFRYGLKMYLLGKFVQSKQN